MSATLLLESARFPSMARVFRASAQPVKGSGGGEGARRFCPKNFDERGERQLGVGAHTKIRA
jgi:hypothetical protein